MKTVSIKVQQDTIEVISPYNAHFVDGARNLAGKWNAGTQAWVFDSRELSDVKALCMEAYGTDGELMHQCDIQVDFIEAMYGDRAPINLFGLTIAKAFGRDSGAKIGDGVRITSGSFSSGGSAKNWHTYIKAGTSIILRDISKSMVDKYSNEDVRITILSVNSNIPSVDHAELLSELKALKEREAEILRILNASTSVDASTTKTVPEIHSDLLDA